MKAIPLTQGKVTLVDDDVYEWASKFKWCAARHRDRFYAVRSYQGQTIYLHREITKPREGLETDHWDNDGLNNQRYNFRVCTPAQNTTAAIRMRANKSSKFRGVTRAKGTSKWWFPKWRAAIIVNKKFKSLGYFKKESGAAKAYDEAAKSYHGEYAVLNFP